MKWINLSSRYILWALNCLLLFLSFFSDKLVIPSTLQMAGRFHPLILHLPIGLILITVLIYVFRNKFTGEPGEVISLLLHIGALTAVLSALFGIFLSKEGGYDEALLSNHRWAGVGISILSALLAAIYNPGKKFPAFTAMILLMVPLLVAGSHYGAVLTHGEDYLNIASETKRIPKVITDSTTIFDAVVEPVLQTKCYSCHNDKKAKGQLVMTSLVKLLEGGKNGKLWVPGDPLNSHIIQRVSLEEDNKKHMPPRGKPQLSEGEITLLSEWIRKGASMETRFMDLLPTDSFRIFAASFIPEPEDIKSYTFPAASLSVIEKLQSPYLTVQPLSNGSPALRADFFIRQGFIPSRIKELEKIALQLVEINLGNMPVRDEELPIFGRFANLEYLNLNGSLITGKGLSALQQCKKLSVVCLAGAPVSKDGLQLLGEMKNISRVYCWNTGITQNELRQLKEKYTHVQWDSGFIPDTVEHLQLTPPLLVNNELFVLGKNDSVALRHPMPGVMIRFTTDGQDPDSNTSAIYAKSFAIDKTTRLKAIAVRPGWLKSDVADFTFFSKGILPLSSRLLTPPDKEYLANGINTLTDGVKGETSNLKTSWLGFRNGYFDGRFVFDSSIYLREIVVSAAKNIGAFVMPPQKIEIWAGRDSLHLKLIKTIIPVQPMKYEPDRIEAHKAEINDRYGCIELKIYPVKKLPLWHGGKGEKAWIFLDEVFFN